METPRNSHKHTGRTILSDLQAPVVTVEWRHGMETELLFGLADGSLHSGQTVKNKTLELYKHPQAAPIVSMSCIPAECATPSPGVIVGHADGSIYRCSFDGAGGAPNATAICKHTCAPYALGCNSQAIVAGGADLILAGYSLQGRMAGTVDLSGEPTLQGLACASVNPSGDTAIIGAFNAFVSLEFTCRDQQWRLRHITAVPNIYSTTALAWDPSGGKLAVGSLTGGVSIYSTSLRRARYCPRGSSRVYDFIWMSRSQIQISAPNASFKITARGNHDITKVDVYRDQFVVAFTTATLLLGNLVTFKLAEIEWQQSGTEKFHFENDRVAMVYNEGELSVIEYERHTPLVTLRTAHISPYLVSCVVSQHRVGNVVKNVKALAYLVDMQAIRVLDIVTKSGPQVHPLMRLCIHWVSSTW
jgi:intraflagellar transport protein 172